MIFVKKKKPHFVFSSPKKLPVVFGKRTNRNYELLVEKYGEPQYNTRDGEPHISGYGVAVFPTGQQFIRDAKTGDILDRSERVRYIGVSRGMHFYIHEDHELLIGDSAFPSFPRK